MYSDREIVQGISSHDSKIISYVYKEFYPFVERFIVSHGGTSQQAQDTFQEAMIIVYKKIMDGNFSLYCKFNTYLHAVCKRIWIQDRKKDMQRMNRLREMPAVAEPEVSYGNSDTDLAKSLFDKHFSKLAPDCQELLRLYFNGLKIREISNVLGMNSVHNTSDKKYRCVRNLVDRIKNDPLFRKIRK